MSDIKYSKQKSNNVAGVQLHDADTIERGLLVLGNGMTRLSAAVEIWRINTDKNQYNHAVAAKLIC